MPSKDYINIVNLPESTVTGSASYTIPAGKVGIVKVKAGAADFTINGVVKMNRKVLADISQRIVHYANSGRPNGVAYSWHTAAVDCVVVARGRHVVNSVTEEAFLINDWYALRWTSSPSTGWGTFYLRAGDVVKVWHHTGTGSGDADYYSTIYSAEGASGVERTFTIEAGTTISGGDYTLEIYKR